MKKADLAGIPGKIPPLRRRWSDGGMMQTVTRKRFFLGGWKIPAAAAMILLVSPAAAREETAHITLQKILQQSQKTQTYTVKKGEWLLDIMRREMDPSPHRYTIIRKLNPQLKDLNRIAPGQVLILPGRGQDEAGTGSAVLPAAAAVASAPGKAPLSIAPDRRLAMIERVVTAMKGMVSTRGSFFLPVPPSGQITIDCAQIPVAEFDDGTIALLDFIAACRNPCAGSSRRVSKPAGSSTASPRSRSPRPC